MRFRVNVLCEKCGKAITPDNSGVIIVGNIYVVDFHTEDNMQITRDDYELDDVWPTGGLIGDNFPKQSPFEFKDIHKVAYHLRCLTQILDYTKVNTQGA